MVGGAKLACTVWKPCKLVEKGIDYVKDAAGKAYEKVKSKLTAEKVDSPRGELPGSSNDSITRDVGSQRQFQHTNEYKNKDTAYQKYRQRQEAQGKKPAGKRQWSKDSGYDEGVAKHQQNTASDHGNSLDTDKPARGYTLRDRDTGEICKYGETTCGRGRYSPDYLDEENVDLEWETPEVSKRDVKKWENENILEYKENNNGNRPRLNLSDH